MQHIFCSRGTYITLWFWHIYFYLLFSPSILSSLLAAPKSKWRCSLLLMWFITFLKLLFSLQVSCVYVFHSLKIILVCLFVFTLKLFSNTFWWMCVCMYVCVCVWEGKCECWDGGRRGFIWNHFIKIQKKEKKVDYYMYTRFGK